MTIRSEARIEVQRAAKQKAAEDLREPVIEARFLAQKLGLDPYPVKYWVVDYDEMNQAVAYGGFQHRYPHWRWGMQYDRQQKQGQYTGGKVYEIVINDNPAHAYLQESNDLADQKAVITHVEAHSDFFSNNRWYGMFADELNAAAMLERHAKTIEGYMEDPDIERDEVERWIDNILCIEDNIDQHGGLERLAERREEEEEDEEKEVQDKLDELGISDEVKKEVFDDEWLEKQKGDGETGNIPEEPEKDLMWFLREYGKQYDEEAEKAVDMEEWQRETLDILRRESYYFAAQKMTKVMNEGWACVTPDTPVFTTEGLIPMRQVVEKHIPVSDGDSRREVYDSNIIPDHDTVTIQTEKGFELTGSNNHRIRRPDGSWVRLDELDEGDEIEISGGNDIWPSETTEIEYGNEIIEVDEEFGRFLGLLASNGKISNSEKEVVFTAEKREQADEFVGLAEDLFRVETSVDQTGSTSTVHIRSDDFIESVPGLGEEDHEVPEQITKSPKEVVCAFVRGLFDAGGKVETDSQNPRILFETESEDIAETTQLLLTNSGVVSRRDTDKELHRLSIPANKESAKIFADEIGFLYTEKESELRHAIQTSSNSEVDEWIDQVISIEEGEETVYDISVRGTHRYAGAGFVNHNSYWESKMMADENFAHDDEFMTYANHLARVLGSPGLNPYKLGKEMWEYIENKKNREEVIDKLLRIEGIDSENFKDRIDFDLVEEELRPEYPLAEINENTLEDLAELEDSKVDREAVHRAMDGEIDVEKYPWKTLTYEGLAERHFSLNKPQNKGFLKRIRKDALEELDRYIIDANLYDDEKDALEEVDYTTGWDAMREIRATHNDVTFLDSYLSQEFVDNNNYFAYEYSHATGDYRATSVDYEDVKKKLMLEFTNFGKPTVKVHDANYQNRNELLLAHHYNGVMLNLKKAKETMKRIFNMWGRPVNLKTITKKIDDNVLKMAKRRGQEPELNEQGIMIRYDGEDFTREELEWEEVEDIAAEELDYSTKPEDWL